MLTLLDPTGQLLGGRIIAGGDTGAAPATAFAQVRKHVEVPSTNTVFFVCVTLQVWLTHQ